MIWQCLLVSHDQPISQRRKPKSSWLSSPTFLQPTCLQRWCDADWRPQGCWWPVHIRQSVPRLAVKGTLANKGNCRTFILPGLSHSMQNKVIHTTMTYPICLLGFVPSGTFSSYVDSNLYTQSFQDGYFVPGLVFTPAILSPSTLSSTTPTVSSPNIIHWSQEIHLFLFIHNPYSLP